MSEPNFDKPVMGKPRIIRNSEPRISQQETILVQDKDLKFKPIEEIKDPRIKTKAATQTFEEKTSRLQYDKTPEIIEITKNK
ncbi:MAG TPA: hypothetical protein VG895_04350 [Patescibacteria group bacterium]|nr:hypothetical protein [Patescibacteria group bacterium]